MALTKELKSLQIHDGYENSIFVKRARARAREHEASPAKEEKEENKISSFIEKLKHLDENPFTMQIENIVDSPFLQCGIAGVINHFQRYIDKYKDRVDLKGIDLGDVKHYSPSEIIEFTNNFSTDNFFCGTRHGRLFKAQISSKKVAVKTVDFYFPITQYSGYYMSRLHDDIVFLRDPLIKSQPNFVKLIGYCCEKKLAFVLDVDPKATVHDLLISDDFVWEARMKVAMDFGRLLKFSHDNLIIYGSIDAKNIMIDQNLDTKFFEFGFHQRLKDKNDKIEFVFQPRRIGYLAPEVVLEDKWSMKSDVYAYGVLLLNLISKRQERNESWFMKEMETGGKQSRAKGKRKGHNESSFKKEMATGGKQSLVNGIFKVDDEHIGAGITKLAMSCVKLDQTDRPDMETVVNKLEDLVGGT